MSRRLLAAAALAAVVVPLSAPPAEAATCGILLDYVVSHYAPGPAQTVYWKVCGV